MKSNYALIGSSTLFFAAALAEVYIIATGANLIPFLACGLVLLASAAGFITAAGEQIASQTQNMKSVYTENQNNLYRLLESRLYNIERYQKAIYNENKSVRESINKLTQGESLPDINNILDKEMNHLNVLSKNLQQSMEQVGRGIIKYNHQDAKLLLDSLDNLKTDSSKDIAAELALIQTNLQQLLELCEKGLLVQSVNTPESASAPAPAAVDDTEDNSIPVAETAPATEDVTAVDEILETEFEAAASIDQILETEPEAVASIDEILEAEPEAVASVEEMAEPVIETAEETVDAVDEVIEPVVETAEETMAAVDEVIEPVVEPETTVVTPVDDNPNRQLTPEEIAAMFAGASDEDISSSSETDSTAPVTDDTVSAVDDTVSDVAPVVTPVDDDPNRQLTPEEIAAMFAGASDEDISSSPETESTAPVTDDDVSVADNTVSAVDDTVSDVAPVVTPVDDNPNRQLTPEEIAAMFANI